MSLVGAPSMAHSWPCHTFSPIIQTKLPILVPCHPLTSPLRQEIYHRPRYIARLSNLHDDAISTPAKFEPFVARNELRRRMLGYYRELPTAKGQVLVVQPVSEEWVEPAADVLTEAFADSMGYVTVYKNFLRRQIRNYLRSHMNLPPKTICLVALLVSKDVLESQSKVDEESGFHSDLEVGDDSGSSNGDGDDIVGDENNRKMSESSNLSAADVAGGMMGDGMGNNFWPSFSNSTDSSSTEQSGSTDISSREATAPRAPKLDPSTAKLVGAVEVSFTESTRTKEWTGLNAPPERPYLCNMAVAEETRRQGIGVLMLEAAEDLVQRVGEDELYLHLRFKDAPAAALYRKAGYTPSAQDSIFVRLVGQDRRWLMKKVLNKE